MPIRTRNSKLSTKKKVIQQGWQLPGKYSEAWGKPLKTMAKSRAKSLVDLTSRLLLYEGLNLIAMSCLFVL